MQIKQDPVTGLWCRSDGAVLMPPCRNIHRFKYTWTFGCVKSNGYRAIQFQGKHYFVHQIVCRTFNGLPPENKPFVDHIDRCKSNNRYDNLHWASVKENNNNKDYVDQSIERFGVRECDSKAAYMKAYYEACREEINARRRVRWAIKAAKMKAQGFCYTKGPDGKWGWYPFKRT